MDASRFLALNTPIPVRHRRKVPFDPTIPISAETADRLGRVTELNHELGGFLVDPASFRSRLEETIAYNLFESVRLEGNPLTLDQVRQITRNSFLGTEKIGRNRPHREIVNHLATWLLPESLSPPWGIPLILALHKELMTDVDPAAKPGTLRTKPRAVVSDETEEVFVTAPPGSIPGELGSLLGWVNQYASALHPVLAGAIFFHEFESIHPFVEGNGRTGRVLFHAYLQCRGLPFAYRTKLEVALLAQPEAYYRVLTWADYSRDYSNLIEYFAEASVEAFQEAVDWFANQDVAGKIGPRAYRLLQLARRHGDWFKLEDVRRRMTDRGDQTLRGELNQLVGEGYLEGRGQTRARSYRFKDPFSTVLQGIAPLRRSLGLPLISNVSTQTPRVF